MLTVEKPIFDPAELSLIVLTWTWYAAALVIAFQLKLPTMPFTVTEKLLLFGNAIQLAGSVKGKKGPHARSDWMTMEQERVVEAVEYDDVGTV